MSNEYGVIKVDNSSLFFESEIGVKIVNDPCSVECIDLSRETALLFPCNGRVDTGG